MESVGVWYVLTSDEKDGQSLSVVEDNKNARLSCGVNSTVAALDALLSVPLGWNPKLWMSWPILSCQHSSNKHRLVPIGIWG